DRERREGRCEGGARRRPAGDRGGHRGAAMSAWAAPARWPRAQRGWRRLIPGGRASEPRPAPATAIFRWDLDKTYLKSDFESLRKMMRVPFERARDKIDEPGVVALICALKASALRAQRTAFVYFISASPPQIGRPIR